MSPGYSLSSAKPAMELISEDFFRVPRRVLTIFGIWPMSSRSLPLFFYINWISLICSSSVGTFHGYANRDDLFQMLDSLTPSITEVVSAIKITMIFYYRKEFCKVCTSLYELYMSGECIKMSVSYCTITFTSWYSKSIAYSERSEEGVKIYKKCDAYSALVVSTLFFFGFVTCTTYIVLPLLYNLYYYVTKQPLVRELPFKAVYVCC